MVEVSTSILNVKKNEESATFFELEAAKTDYFHIDVMDGKFVSQDTYHKMIEYSNYIKKSPVFIRTLCLINWTFFVN